MKILSMTATFGKLDGQTLDLTDGVNVLSAPNEWGKSTWCAFLSAMLYGIDTRERSTRDQLADKERFLPWSGKPMEGRLRLIHEGRDITIQRRTNARAPMGEFYAYETLTGVPVRELTAENCGQTLLGVEKSVFQRTGFLRFSDLPVRQDEHLRRRLNNLVTTGDETGGGELLGEKLRELKNRCRHPNSGLIPECRNRIHMLQEQLLEQQTLQRQYDALDSRIRSREAELQELELHRQWLDYREGEAHTERVAEAAKAAQNANWLVQALSEKYANLPDHQKLHDQLKQDQAQLRDLTLDAVEPPRPSIPVAVPAALGAVLLIAALLLADSSLLIPCIVMGVVMLLAAYGLVSQHRQAVLWYNIQQARRKNQREALVKSISAREGQLRTYDDLQAAMDYADKAASHHRALSAMDLSAPEPEAPDPLTISQEETLQAIRELTPQLNRSRMQLGQYRGRMEHLPDPELLRRQLQLERDRLSELEKTVRAIELAQEALESASRELQRRFAPRISRRAGEFLRQLTGGVYDRIIIGEDLTVQAARDDETTLRTAQWRSEGTGDQMYLALRLAVWEVLSPQCPIVLDDALIRFDQTRMERAMDLLRELGKTRQILLFSCQDREKEYLDRLAPE